MFNKTNFVTDRQKIITSIDYLVSIKGINIHYNLRNTTIANYIQYKYL